MKPLAAEFVALAVGRDYLLELQPALRELADACGKSRAQIDEDGGLPEGWASKALAPVPVGTTDNPGAKLLGKLLKGIGAVLIVARVNPDLARAADLGVKRRDEMVHAKLLDNSVFAAARARFARENGSKGGAARWRLVKSAKNRKRIAKRAAKARWRKHRLNALKRPDLMRQVQL